MNLNLGIGKNSNKRSTKNDLEEIMCLFWNFSDKNYALKHLIMLKIILFTIEFHSHVRSFVIRSATQFQTDKQLVKKKKKKKKKYKKIKRLIKN